MWEWTSAVSSASNAEKQISTRLCLLHFYKKTRIPLNTLPHARLLVCFCYKYFTDMSNLTYLFTDLPYFFRKNTDSFYRVHTHEWFTFEGVASILCEQEHSTNGHITRIAFFLAGHHEDHHTNHDVTSWPEHPSYMWVCASV